MLQLLKRYWAVIRRPSVHFSLGFLTIGGFIAGILFWGGFQYRDGSHKHREVLYGLSRDA